MNNVSAQYQAYKLENHNLLVAGLHMEKVKYMYVTQNIK